MFGDATPGGVGPIQDTITAQGVNIPVNRFNAIVAVGVFDGQPVAVVRLLFDGSRFLCPCVGVCSIARPVFIILPIFLVDKLLAGLWGVAGFM